MHIKRVVIKGFKSYRDEIVVGPLSPHHNVILARNGAGKSNIFHAIRFLISDFNLSQRERLDLLHQGSQRVLSAFVEITFETHVIKTLNCTDKQCLAGTRRFQEHGTLKGKEIQSEFCLVRVKLVTCTNIVKDVVPKR